MQAEVKQLCNLDARERSMLAAAVWRFLPLYERDSRSAVNKLRWHTRLIGQPRGAMIGRDAAHGLFRAALGEQRPAAVPSLN